MNIRGLAGLIVGVVVGLLLVNLLNSALIEKDSHTIPGAIEVIIVFFVAVIGAAAGDSTIHRDGD
jgi:uncharacterized protein YacL